MKLSLIENWRDWWKFWSVRCQVIGGTLIGFADELPGAFAYVWGLMPTEVVATIPPGWVRNVGLGLVGLGTVLRAVRQSKLHRSDP